MFILSQVAGEEMCRRNPPAGPHRPPHKASGHLESKTAKCGGICAGSSGKSSPPKSNFSPPSKSQRCRGAKRAGKEEPSSVTPNISSQPPSILSRSPWDGPNPGNTGSPRGKRNISQPGWDSPTVHSDLDLFTKIKSTGINDSFQVGQG